MLFGCLCLVLITRLVVGLRLYVALIDCVVVLVVCVVFVWLGLAAWFLVLVCICLVWDSCCCWFDCGLSAGFCWAFSCCLWVLVYYLMFGLVLFGVCILL